MANLILLPFYLLFVAVVFLGSPWVAIMAGCWKGFKLTSLINFLTTPGLIVVTAFQAWNDEEHQGGLSPVSYLMVLLISLAYWSVLGFLIWGLLQPARPNQM